MKKMQYENFLPNNAFWTHSEIIQEYGSKYKRNFENSLILKDEELFNTYKNDDLVSVSIQDDEKKISKKLIHDMLSQEGMYKYLQTNLDNSLGIALRIDYIIDKDTFLSIKITRAELIEVLNVMADELSQKEQMRSAVIKHSLHLFSCQQKYRNYNHSCFIEGNEVIIPASTLISILTMDDNTFKSFMDDKIYLGFKKEYIAYALIDFVERERLFIKYVLPESVYKRYKDLASYSLIDFESINKNRVRNDINEDGESILDKIEISEELMNSLDEQKELTYSDLELSIYYYIKLCEILTFDTNYYLTHTIDLSDEELEKISTITSTNNQTTSYEFLLLFAKIISNLDIDFTFDQTIFAGIINGSHKLTYKHGEYLVALNSLDNIGKSDLTNVKVNDKLANLTCINKNEVTRNKFNELVEKVYGNIISKREEQIKFKQAVDNYKNMYEYTKTSTRDKLYLLLKEICRTDLKGLQTISYAKKVFDNLFKNDSRVQINFICSQNEYNSYIKPISIVSIEESGGYSYFVIDSEKENTVSYMHQEELMEMFETKTYLYVDNKKIPGLEVVGEVYAR